MAALIYNPFNVFKHLITDNPINYCHLFCWLLRMPIETANAQVLILVLEKKRLWKLATIESDLNNILFEKNIVSMV